MELCTYKIVIKGTVQGVGFRPFVYALSQRYLVTGTVSNDSSGVTIFVNADTLTFKQFIIAVEYECPILAIVNSVEYEEIRYQAFDDFHILQTQEDGDVRVNIPADVSLCTACEKELFDPNNRRFSYPFINCTHCGVRYSIIYDLPYDREKTSMKFFKMCKRCEEEYTNPLDRRYHAQPIGCWDCGPSLTFWDKDEKLIIDKSKIIDKVVGLLEDGAIIAVKGVGGYHLMCDASNEDAVTTLRERKNRPTKPFAVMVKDMTMAKELAKISRHEEELLTSKERPIVLLDAKAYKNSHGVAPHISRMGFFFLIHLCIFSYFKS